MTGDHRGRIIFSIALCVPLGIVNAQEDPNDIWPQDQSVGVPECSFKLNPDEFLGREAQIRRDVWERARKLNGALAARRGATVPASSLPVRNLIDEEIFGKLAKLNVPAARMASDEEFLRRVTLDLTGRIPSSAEVRAFLADASSDKRDLLIDRLLYSPEFTERWTMWVGDWLQNTSDRLAMAAITRGASGRNAFFNWIQEAVYSEKSFRDLAYEVVTAAGNSYDSASGPVNWVLGGDTAMGPVQDRFDTLLVKSATTFLGLSYYDCLLCHNGRGHLESLSLWGTRTARAEAWRMAAFFARTDQVRYPENQVAGQPTSFYFNSYIVGDRISGTYDLNTTFGNRPNRTPVGATRNLTPEYRLGGAPSNAGWRGEFAELLVRDPMFARNIVNRLWKHMFNLGLVEPVYALDPARLDPANPPPEPWSLQATHPALLEKLAAEFAGMNYQLRPFLRLLAQSTVYQLSSRYDGEWRIDYVPLFARHYARRLEAEEVHDAIAKATDLLGSYPVQGWSENVRWAMQLPDTIEPRGNGGNAATFMNYFLRGNRDGLPRSQTGSIQQQLALMNDTFVRDRVQVARSAKLRAIGQMTRHEEILEEIYITFLGRLPSEYERSRALAYLARKATTAALRNEAVEDLAWATINKAEFIFSY